MNIKIKGYRPSTNEAIKAKCCECCAQYDDGRKDCEHFNCPLYYKMPYAKYHPEFDWIFVNTGNKYIKRFNISSLSKEEFIKTYIYDFDNGKIKIPVTHIIRAKCFSCCNNFRQPGIEKGRIECSIKNCSLYYWAPYRKQFPEYDWMFDLNYTSRHRTQLLISNISREKYIINLLKRKPRTANHLKK